MTYDALETSVHGGRPVELYLFQSASEAWQYTSADQDITVSALLYSAVPIGRGEIESGENVAKANLVINTAINTPLVTRWMEHTLDELITLTIYRYHDGDAEVVAYWKGRVLSISVTGPEASIQCESVFTSLKRPGLRARYQKSCRHALYQRGCNVTKATFAVAGVVSAVDGAQVTVTGADAFDDRYFTGGMLETADGIFKTITGHAGENLAMSGPVHGLEATDAVTLYPGCDHSMETCDEVFDNLDNYGGFPWIPPSNPMGGSSII